MAQAMAAGDDQPWESAYFKKLYAISKVEFEKKH